MRNKEEVKKKIENILNRYYKETGKEIISPIFIYKLLNKNFKYKMVVKFNEQDGLKKLNKKQENLNENIKSN